MTGWKDEYFSEATVNGVAKGYLIAARLRISDIDNWCRGSLAYNGDDVSVRPESEQAVRWCSLGALLHAANGFEDKPKCYQRAVGFITNVARNKYGLFVADVNDNMEHDDVLQMFDEAIALASGD